MIKILKKLCKEETVDKIARIFIYAFIAECTFGSSGRWISFGPISIRILLFAICFIATLPAVFRNIKAISRNFQVVVTVCFGFYLLICALIGLVSGNDKSFIWADLSTLMTLALFPGFMAVMCNKKSIKQAIDIVFWTSTIFAAATVVFHIVLPFLQTGTIVSINNMINKASLGGFAQMQTGVQRIFMKSQIFFQVSIIYGVWKIISGGSIKSKVLFSVCIGVLFSGCILSYTRGFWVGLAASAVIVFIFSIKYWKKYVKTFTMAFSVFLLIFSLSWAVYQSPVAFVEIINRFNPNLIVIDGINDDEIDFEQFDEDDSVEKNNFEAASIRNQSLKLSKEKIAQSPIFGNGLGENLDQIRDDGKIEYMYIDMTMKTGVLGTLIFIITFFGFVIIQILQDLNIRKFGLESAVYEKVKYRNLFLIAAYLGVAVTSFFNPFLNNPMGIMLLMLTATAVYDGKQKNREV